MNSHWTATRSRSALSLMELLVVIAILAVLIALLLPAIQQVRLTALRMKSTSDMRQFLLATHSFASSHNDLVPSVDGNYKEVPGLDVVPAMEALFPYMEATKQNPPQFMRFSTDPSWQKTTIQSSPGVQNDGRNVPLSSIAFNAYTYSNNMKLSTSFRDGLSSTIAMSEHYGICQEAWFDINTFQTKCYELPDRVVKCPSNMQRRNTFADDKMFEDVFPVASSSSTGPISVGSLPLTFQVRPTLVQCDPRIPQSSIPGGLLCGFVDGSVRFIRPSVSEAAFWSSVTPNGGEVVALD